MKKSKKSGISLIVLVITIIVIIILAVAVILTIANNNPIENAKQAVKANDEATLKEAATVAQAQWYTEKQLDPTITKKVGEYVEETLASQGFKAEDIAKVAATEDGVNIVTIPNGFRYLEGKASTEGYVIKNETDGNEFVWVPVNNISNFVREEGYSCGSPQSKLPDCSEPYETENYTSEIDEYNAMIASVSKYGGFYIGRYEASDNGSGVAQSLKDKAPWNSIAWGDSITEVGTTGAVAKARAVYSVESGTKEKDPVSTLIYGVQWDATVRWIKTNYPGIEKNSTDHGNHNTGSKINTGSNPSYKLNNIYDLAGNVEELTMEACSSYSVVGRGGEYVNTGSDSPVSARCDYPFLGFDFLGFRLALYIK